MHPDVTSDRPGSCPICGMALEPRTVSEDTDVDPELADMSRRFWISVALTTPLLLLSMAQMVSGFSLASVLSGRTLVWIQLALATAVVVWGGLPFFERGWTSLVHRKLNMFTLIALGTGAAYVFSAIAALTPAVFPASFRDQNGEVAVYFEPAAVIITLVLLGPGPRAAGAPPDRQRDPVPCSGLLPRPRGGSERMVARRTSRSTRSFPATGSGFVRARRFRSTGSSPKARARSTNR